MSSIDAIIQDALRTRYAIVIDDNFTNYQEACDYIATLPKDSILIFAWHRHKDLRLQSAAYENGLIIEDLTAQDDGLIQMFELAHDANDFKYTREFLLLVNMDAMILWYDRKPKNTKSLRRDALKMGIPIIENPTLPKQLSLFD